MHLTTQRLLSEISRVTDKDELGAEHCWWAIGDAIYEWRAQGRPDLDRVRDVSLPRGSHMFSAFVIDTEVYAGGFERQMCAWVTGRIGECDVGQDLAEQAEESMSPELLVWCNEHVCDRTSRGTDRPVSIFPTPGWFSVSGTHYRDKDWGSAEMTKVWEASTRKEESTAADTYHESVKAIVKERAAKRLEGQLKTGPLRDQAYQSVGIYISERPPEALCKEMRERALFFAAHHHSHGALSFARMAKFSAPVMITGFRFVEVRKVEETLEFWSIDD